MSLGIGSLVSSKDEGKSLNDEWYEVRGLWPALYGNFVALLDIDRDFASYDVSARQLSLNES